MQGCPFPSEKVCAFHHSILYVWCTLSLALSGILATWATGKIVDTMRIKAFINADSFYYNDKEIQNWIAIRKGSHLNWLHMNTASGYSCWHTLRMQYTFESSFAVQQTVVDAGFFEGGFDYNIAREIFRNHAYVWLKTRPFSLVVAVCSTCQPSVFDKKIMQRLGKVSNRHGYLNSSTRKGGSIKF